MGYKNDTKNDVFDDLFLRREYELYNSSVVIIQFPE